LFEHDLFGKPVPDHALDRQGGAGMRMLVAFLVVLGVICLWDANFNNGILTDGAKTMLRDIKNNIR
jgi:hypothetical protein